MKPARPATLNISAIPFRSSNLAIPPSPFSPRLPLTPPPSSATPRRRATASATAQLPRSHTVLSGPPPLSPLHWVWQCHVCRLRYPLGVTRRCLEDGHLFCAGTTTVRVKRRRNGDRARVLRRGRACSSEFDYQGWNAWAAWRQGEQHARRLAAGRVADGRRFVHSGSAVLRPSAVERMDRELLGQPRFVVGGKMKDCWNQCNYPSECRWGPQMQQSSPAISTASDSSSSSTGSDPEVDATSASVRDPADSETAPMTVDTREVATTFDGILENIDGSSQVPRPAAESEARESGSAMRAILSALRLSASRRNSVGAPSPLARESAIDDSPGQNERPLQERSADYDESGDVIMRHVDTPYSKSEEKLTAPASGSGASEIELVMPLTLELPGISHVYDQERQRSEESRVSGRAKSSSRKGYAGYVETLRKMNRV